MSDRVPYDEFAQIYDAWVNSVPLAEAMRSFYVELMVESDDPVVELGVGNGRICIEAARHGRRVVGVDSSTAILELCGQRAEAAKVSDRLELLQADFRDFVLAEPAALITIPFHSIGHLPTDADKRACMERVHSQLVPGGRFVWDHFVFDPGYPEGERNLRADIRDDDGSRRRIWESSTRDATRRMIDIAVRIEDLDADGAPASTRDLKMEMSWIEPERSRELLEQAGFEIEALWGEFDQAPFAADSSHQIWCARRPRA